MVGHGTDTANDPAIQQGLHPAHDFFASYADLLANGVVRPGHQWQTALRSNNQGAVNFIHHSLASSFISTKNSRSFGNA